jgi:hypothetical protein
MKVDKTLPAHRETSDRSPVQTKRISPSVGQIWAELMPILQREAVFGLQLLLAFSVSYTAVQMSRTWLSQSGMIAPAPSVYSARVFWPENTLALFPKPIAPVAAAVNEAPKPNKASTITKQPVDDKTMLDKPIQIAVTRTPVTQQNTRIRLQTSPQRSYSAYRWANPSPRYIAQPRYVRRPAAVRKPAVVRQRQQPKAPTQIAQKPRVQASQNASLRPIQRMLREDYQVSRLKSYDEYMKWVKQTLKDYNGG